MCSFCTLLNSWQLHFSKKDVLGASVKGNVFARMANQGKFSSRQDYVGYHEEEGWQAHKGFGEDRNYQKSEPIMKDIETEQLQLILRALLSLESYGHKNTDAAVLLQNFPRRALLSHVSQRRLVLAVSNQVSWGRPKQSDEDENSI